MKRIIGIDLGTTNSLSATVFDEGPEVIGEGENAVTPSVLSRSNSGWLVGQEAQERRITNPKNTVNSIKRLMGRSLEELSETVKDLPYQIVEAQRQLVKVRIGESKPYKEFTPQELSAEILKKVKQRAEEALGESVEKAVITVPAYFTSTQIDETKKAGEAAGFIIKRIITEPVAAAIAYGIDDKVDQTLFIVDIGGGTFDTSILQVKGSNFNTLAVDGDSKLGGDDFDNHILEALLKYIRKDQGVNLSTHAKSDLDEDKYRKAYQALVNRAEEIKIELSEFESTNIDIANLFSGYNLSMTMTRAEFEEISSSSIEKIKRKIQSTMSDNNFDPSDIDKVVLVGGSSKIPVVREFVTELFNKQPYADKPLDKLVAMGAAILAHQSETVQSKIEISDIISHSLGIELINDKFSAILVKNSLYPISKSQMYTTTVDFQEKLSVKVYEGEDECQVTNNSFYGGFILDNIERSYAGNPQIEVTFEFDINRILKVTARDLNTDSNYSETISIDKTITQS